MLDHVAEEVFDDDIDRADLARYLADPAQALIVAMANDVVVGQIKTILHRHPEKPPTLFVEELGVAPTHRRRGLGTALLHAAEAIARARGCTEIWLATEPDNAAANAVYAAAGWSPQQVTMYSRTLEGD
ncbi:MAG: GNAT family N-acetyltransferase [Pseudomonadota bacterium]